MWPRKHDDRKCGILQQSGRCSITKPPFLALWGSYAGSHTAPVPGDAPAMGVAAMLSAQPHTSQCRKQEEVERELGLEDQAASTYLQNLCGGTHENRRYLKTVKELAAAGVYRVLGRKTPRRV